MASRVKTALDAAVVTLGAALPLEEADAPVWETLTQTWAAAGDRRWRLLRPVARRPTRAQDVPPDSAGVVLAAALSEGETVELAYLLGASEPHELLHRARLEILAAGGPEDARRAALDDALVACGAAVAADPTLGGLVDFAELEPGAPFDGDEDSARGFVGVTALLSLTYCAAHPNA